jgi:hypothetical protein
MFTGLFFLKDNTANIALKSIKTPPMANGAPGNLTGAPGSVK